MGILLFLGYAIRGSVPLVSGLIDGTKNNSTTTASCAMRTIGKPSASCSPTSTLSACEYLWRSEILILTWASFDSYLGEMHSFVDFSTVVRASCHTWKFGVT